jgi:hypothetical protein
VFSSTIKKRDVLQRQPQQCGESCKNFVGTSIPQERGPEPLLRYVLVLAGSLALVAAAGGSVSK